MRSSIAVLVLLAACLFAVSYANTHLTLFVSKTPSTDEAEKGELLFRVVGPEHLSKHNHRVIKVESHVTSGEVTGKPFHHAVMCHRQGFMKRLIGKARASGAETPKGVNLLCSVWKNEGQDNLHTIQCFKSMNHPTDGSEYSSLSTFLSQKHKGLEIKIFES